MKRKLTTFINLLMITASVVFTAQPTLLVDAATTTHTGIIDTETVLTNEVSSPDALEYYGASETVPIPDSGGDGVSERSPSERDIIVRPLGNPFAPADSRCMLQLEVALIPNDGSVVRPDPAQIPETRATFENPALSKDGYDYGFSGSPATQSNFIRPLPGDPPGTGNDWPAHPGVLPESYYDQFFIANNTVDILDGRINPSSNYGALRGENAMLAIVYIANVSNEPFCDGARSANAQLVDVGDGSFRPEFSPLVPAITAEGASISAISAGSGQNIIFHDLQFELSDANGVLAGTERTLTRADFFSSFYNTDSISGWTGPSGAVSLEFDGDTYPTLDPNDPVEAPFDRREPGLLERAAQGGSAGINNKYTQQGSFLAVFEVDIPAEASEYIQARVFDGRFQCTYFNTQVYQSNPETLAACPGTGGTADILTASRDSWYVLPLTGPWLYQDGETNTGGAAVPNYNPYGGTDPFQVVHTVGGEVNREAGDNVWFVIEAKNKWGDSVTPFGSLSDDETVRHVRTITPISSNITTPCSNTADPGGGEGWYSSVIIDPVTGPTGGSTPLSYTDPGGGVPWVGDMQLGEDESVYCVFRRTLSSPGTNFEINVELDAISYSAGPYPNEIEVPLIGSRNFPIAPASIDITKRVSDPLVGTPPNTAPGFVRPGDIVTYEITVTNTGEVPLDNIVIEDSLIGFVPKPNTILTPATQPFVCPGGFTCVNSFTEVLTREVDDEDPQTIFNSATVRAEILNTDIELTAQDSASILQAGEELPIVISAVGNISGQPNPILGTDTSVIYTMTYTNGNLPSTGPSFTQIEFTQRPDGGIYPLLQNPNNLGDPDDSLEDWLPSTHPSGHAGYPEIALYSDMPPNAGSALLIPQLTPPNENLFDPNPTGTIGSLSWEYDLPALPAPGQPWSDSTLYQFIQLEATRDDATNSKFRNSESLLTQIINPDLTLNVNLLDRFGNPFTSDTVLRGEILQFDINIEFNEPTDRCDVYLRQYLVDTSNGSQQLINADIPLAWTGGQNELLGVGTPTTIGLPVGLPLPSYQVPDDSLNPLVFAFEIDMRTGCNAPDYRNNLIARNTLNPLRLSDVNIDTQLLIVTNAPNSTTPVEFGVYPRPALTVDPEYQILYAATNRGPLSPEIIDWKYCIVDSPKTDDENCDDGGISMYDGFGDDLDVTGPFGDQSRIFTLDRSRLDYRLFSLERGQTYPNPLIIRVSLEVTTTGQVSDRTIINSFITLPLITDDLNLTLDSLGEDTIVRGDHGVRVQFTFRNTTDDPSVPDETLENVGVINLINPEAGGRFPPALANIQPNTEYRLCQFDAGSVAAGGSGSTTTNLVSLPPGGSASGFCEFDFTDDVEVEGEVLEFRAMVVANSDVDNRDIFDIRLVEYDILQHLDVEKTGPAAVLNSQDIDYTVTVTNNSNHQYVDFENLTGFRDVFSPQYTNSTLCIVPDGTVVTGGDSVACNSGSTSQVLMEHVVGVTNVSGSIYRLAERDTATISYRLRPNGAHGEDAYLNTAIFEGAREGDPLTTVDNTLVSGSDDSEIEIDCPIELTYSLVPAGFSGGLGDDFIFTLGEEVTIFVRGSNNSSTDIRFDTFLDPRYQQDVDNSISNITFLENVIEWYDVNDVRLTGADRGLLPVGGYFFYSYNMRINVPDFLAPEVDRIYNYNLGYTTSLGVPTSPGCSSSIAALDVAAGNPDTAIDIGIPLLAPIRAFKYVDNSVTPQPIIGENSPIKFVIEVRNYSETTDIQLMALEESLFDGDGNLTTGTNVLVEYCDTPACTSFTTSASGVMWRFPYDPNTLLIPDPRPIVGLDPTDINLSPDYQPPNNVDNGGLPIYTFRVSDLPAPDAEELINRVTERYNVISSDAAWIDLPPSATTVPTQLNVFFDTETLVVNPLAVIEQVLSPVNRIASQPGTIQYRVTVVNTSDQYNINNIVIDLDSLSNVVRVLPLCSVPPYDTIDLAITPEACLPDPYPFSLAPGQSRSVIVEFDVDASTPGLVETQVQAFGDIEIDGNNYPLNPPAQSEPPNVVQVEEAQLTVKHQVYGDDACTIPLINVTVPPRDRNNDDIPEVALGESFFYGIEIYVGSNFTFADVLFDIDMFNGDDALTNSANAELLQLATDGTNPNVRLVGGTTDEVEVRDDGNPANTAEAVLCIPQPVGYAINSRQPDPLIIQNTISGIIVLDTYTYTTVDAPIPEDQVGLYVEQNIEIDVTDPNLFISKSASPSAAFPGEVVEYTITITNLTNDIIRVHDVYDDNIGVGQQFFDYDGNPATPAEPVQFWHPTNPGLSSIDFYDYQILNTLGNGWSWGVGDEGLIPANSSITYVYFREISAIDPNPLYNIAGVNGFIDNASQDIVSDITRHALLISNSQLNVRKTASPTETILGSTILYEVEVTNIGDEPVYDIIVWDDRFNLEYSPDGNPTTDEFDQFLPNTPGNVSILTSAVSNLGTSDPNKLDLAPFGTTGSSVLIRYNLPVPPKCVDWSGNPNEPYDSNTQSTPGNQSSTCVAYTGSTSDIIAIDPFINTAYAVGLIDDGGTLVYLDDVGFDRATVDIINPDISISKTPASTTGSIGADLEYTVTVTNTGSDDLRIDEVIDMLGGGITRDVSLTYDSCELRDGVTTDPVITGNNIQGYDLVPFDSGSGGSPDNNIINVDINGPGSSVLPAGCSATGTITIEIPNPLPDNEYTNTAQVTGLNLSNGRSVVDTTSATIDVTSRGLSVAKRGLNCDTTSNGVNTPNTPINGNGDICTFLTTGAGAPGAELVTERSEGQNIFYELLITNAGTTPLTSLQISDLALEDLGSGLVPYQTQVPDTNVYTDAVGNTYAWTNGQLIIGVESYRGTGLGNCGVDNLGTPATDESYTCLANYYGTGNGPFGADNPATTDRDESYMFEAGESLERPDPGPVDSPAIVYEQQISFPEYDIDGNGRYINQVRVFGTPYDPGNNGILPVSQDASYTIDVTPATLDIEAFGCATNPDTSGDGILDAGETVNLRTNGCSNVILPGDDVYYAYVITSASALELENIAISDTVRGNIPVGDCYDSSSIPFTGVLTNTGDIATCVYARSLYDPIPLSVLDDPYSNFVTVDFDIDTGSTVIAGNPVTDASVVRISTGELLVSANLSTNNSASVTGSCNTIVQAPGNTPVLFDVTVDNLGATFDINDIEIFGPASLVAPFNLTPGTNDTFTNAATVVVSLINPTTTFEVRAAGYLQDGSPAPGRPLEATFSCDIQRVDGDLVVTKQVVSGSFAQPGDTVRYRITIENRNPLFPASNLVVTDPLLENEPQTPPLVNWATAWPSGLAPNSTLVREFEYVVDGFTDPVINIVSVTGDVGTVTYTASGQARVNVSTGDITVENRAPNTVIAGETITFTYEICNRATYDPDPNLRDDYRLQFLADTDPSGTTLVDSFGQPFVADTLVLEAQQCITYTRDVATATTDGGLSVERTVAADACLVDKASPTQQCDLNSGVPTLIVGDSQSARVNVIFEPSVGGIVDARLTADRVGVAFTDVVTYTLRLQNLNTISNATVTVNPGGVSLPSNIFPFTVYNLAPLQVAYMIVPYSYPGNPDPLVAEVQVDYAMANGVNGTIPLDQTSLTLPVSSVTGSNLIVQVQTLEAESTPGGTVTYQYTVTNIGNDAITDAYIYNPTFSPATTPNATSIFDPAMCSPLTVADDWAIGNTGTTDPNAIARFVPRLFANGFSRTASVVCTIATDYQLDPPTNLLHTINVNKLDLGTGPTNPNLGIQDTADVLQDIVPPLTISVAQLGTGVPGGNIQLEFTVTNIGPSTITGASINPILFDQCTGGTWADLLPIPTDPTSLWNAAGTTLTSGQTLTATATCPIPLTIIPDTQTGGTFTYPSTGDVEVLLDGNAVATATPINLSVQRLATVRFVPPPNNSTLDFVRAGDPFEFGVVITNIAPAGTPISDIQYTFTVNGVANACTAEAAYTRDGSPYTGELTNNGDEVYLICSYTPQTTEHGNAINIEFSGSHDLNGVRIDLPTSNPYAAPVVEDVDFTVTLVGTGATTQGTHDDGETIQFTLTVQNTGQADLTNIQLAEAILNANTGAVVNGKTLTITGATATTLSTLYAEVCPVPLPAGDTCTLASPTSTAQLSLVVAPTDPQRFLVTVSGTADTTSASNVQLQNSSTYTATIARPIFEVPGAENGEFSDTSGKAWRLRTDAFSFTPTAAVDGDQITFSITLSNTGFKELTGITVTSTLNQATAAGLRPVSTSNQALPGNLVFNLPATNLAPNTSTNAQATWQLQGTQLPANLVLNLNVTANVVGGNYQPYNLNLPIPVVIQDANAVNNQNLNPTLTEPVITKTASTDSAGPNSPIIWTVTVSNQSTDTMTGVTVTDNVPGDLIIDSATSTLGASLVNGQLVDVTIGPLDPGQTATIVINTTVVAEPANFPGTITNVATVQRQDGTAQTAEFTVALGADGIIPETGIGGSASIQSPSLAQRLPFAAAIFGVFFAMLFLGVGISNRQRMILAALALFIIVILVGGALLLTGGGDGDDEVIRPSDLDGSPPPDDAQFATATPLPTEVAVEATPTIAPTIAPDALATIESFPATATPYIVPTAAGPRRLDIPSLGFTLPIPIVELPQINNEWDVTNLGHNIGWLDNTTWLDNTWGNTVLVGHIQLSDTDPGPFYELNRLVPGDEIRVIEGGDVTYFQVTEIYTVPPTEIEVTHPTLDPTLTLITCTEWDENRGVFSDRLVVRAIPLPEVADGS